jgi:hypothetical protein
VNLTVDNTAIVLDSTADVPDASEHFANWRVVPLYVNFGTESYKDGVQLSAHEFYDRLRESGETPTTSQPTPADFLATYEELGAYERILSIHIASTLSGTFQSAGTAAAQLGDERVRTIDSQSASVAIAMLALAIQRRLERGTTDEEVDDLVARFLREHGLLFTVDTLEYLARGGRIGKAKAFAGKLAQVQENDNAAFLPSNAESTVALQEFVRFVGNESLPTTVVFQRDGGLTGQDRRAIEGYVRQLRQVEHVDAGGVSGPTYSRDGEAAQIVAPSSPPTASRSRPRWRTCAVWSRTVHPA